MPYRSNPREDRAAEAECELLEARLRQRHEVARQVLVGLAVLALLGAGALYAWWAWPASDREGGGAAAWTPPTRATRTDRQGALLALTGAYARVATQQARMGAVLAGLSRVVISDEAERCPELARGDGWYEAHQVATTELESFALATSWDRLRELARSLARPELSSTEVAGIMLVAVGRSRFELFVVGEVVDRPTMVVRPGPGRFGLFVPGRFVGRGFLWDWSAHRVTCASDVDVESSSRLDDGDGAGALDDSRLLRDLHEVARRAAVINLAVAHTVGDE